MIVHFRHDGRNKSDQQGAVGDTVFEMGRLGKFLVDVNTVVVSGNSGKQINVGFGNRFGENFSGTDLKIIQCHCTSL